MPASTTTQIQDFTLLFFKKLNCSLTRSVFKFIPFFSNIIPFFFFNDTATTEIYTLSLHDALPISSPATTSVDSCRFWISKILRYRLDRKSTRLNSSHDQISYAVFCLKKKQLSLGWSVLYELNESILRDKI